MAERTVKEKIKWTVRIALHKAFVMCRFKKISDEDVYSFMCASNRFKNAGYERHWYLLNEDRSKKGFVWFKHLLGGWRLRLDTDKGDEWQERGVIETVSQMKKFF